MNDFDDINARGLVLVGCGRMGGAMLQGWLARGLDAGAVYGLPAALACTVAGVALTVAGHRWVSRQVATAQRETVVS